MPDPVCASCGDRTAPSLSFDFGDKRYCPKCFTDLAMSHSSRLTGDDRKRLKQAVKDELSGVLPLARIKEILEDGYARILQGDDFDEELGRSANNIARAAGMEMCKDLLQTLETLKAALEEQIEVVRDKMTKLASL